MYKLLRPKTNKNFSKFFSFEFDKTNQPILNIKPVGEKMHITTSHSSKDRPKLYTGKQRQDNKKKKPDKISVVLSLKNILQNKSLQKY